MISVFGLCFIGTTEMAGMLAAIPGPGWQRAPDSTTMAALAGPVHPRGTLAGPREMPGPRARLVAARYEVAGVVAGRRAESLGGRAGGALSIALAGGPFLELRTQALATRRPERPGGGGLRSAVSARFGDVFRFSAGAAMERDLAIEGAPTRGVFSLGIARQLRDVGLDLELEHSRRSVRVTSLVTPEPPSGDTLPPVPYAVERARLVPVLSARLASRWRRGRWMLETAAGAVLHRFAAPRRWAQSSLSRGLGRDLAVCATVGSFARPWLALEPSAERRASIGLRLSPGIFPAMPPSRDGPSERATWRLIRAPRNWTTIQIHAAAAERVEVIGDFTGWQPLSLRRMAGSRWEVGLRLGPGVHLVNVRVDGGPWRPPAGLPTADDGFGGVAGVLVIE